MVSISNCSLFLLDLFCGAGGAADGYYNAGFTDIVGVDIEEQPEYPYDFVQGDAIQLLEEGYFDLDRFHLIHASPPCQDYSRLNSLRDNEYERLIPITREYIKDRPYVIENVVGASKELNNAILLCGVYFGLDVVRHRLFETNIYVREPKHLAHKGKLIEKQEDRDKEECVYWGVYGHFVGSKEEWRKALGIDRDLKKSDLAQAVPPAYTEYIGRKLKPAVRQAYGLEITQCDRCLYGIKKGLEYCPNCEKKL